MRQYTSDEMVALLARSLKPRPGRETMEDALPQHTEKLSAQHIRTRFPELSAIFDGALGQANRDVRESGEPDEFEQLVVLNFLIRATLEGHSLDKMSAFLRSLS